MIFGRVAYALNLIFNAIKEEMVREDWDILNQGKKKLKGLKLEKAIKENMNQYYWDIDKVISPCYEFLIEKKNKILTFTRMNPYILELQEITTDFYENFRYSLIEQVKVGIKKEGKLKDKDKIEGLF